VREIMKKKLVEMQYKGCGPPVMCRVQYCALFTKLTVLQNKIGKHAEMFRHISS